MAGYVDFASPLQIRAKAATVPYDRRHRGACCHASPGTLPHDTSPVQKSMKGVEPVQAAPSQVNKQQQEQDWLMIGIMLTIPGIMIGGFLALGVWPERTD